MTNQGRLEEAIAHFSQALHIEPHYADAHNNLGVALAGKGRLDEAIDHYYEALRVQPDHKVAHVQLALALLRQERTEKALEHYHEALRLSPDSPMVLNNLAWILATHENPNFRDGARAVQLAEKACRLTGHENAAFLDTLAAAYAEAAQFNEALQTAQKAIELALAMGRVEAGEGYRKEDAILPSGGALL